MPIWALTLPSVVQRLASLLFQLVVTSCENIHNFFQEFAVFIVLELCRRPDGFTNEVQRCHTIREDGDIVILHVIF